MVGSTAVVGARGAASPATDTVGLYYLAAMSIDGVQLKSSLDVSGTLEARSRFTSVGFSLPISLNLVKGVGEDVTSDSCEVTHLIFARGESNTLGYHGPDDTAAASVCVGVPHAPPTPPPTPPPPSPPRRTTSTQNVDGAGSQSLKTDEAGMGTGALIGIIAAAACAVAAAGFLYWWKKRRDAKAPPPPPAEGSDEANKPRKKKKAHRGTMIVEIGSRPSSGEIGRDADEAERTFSMKVGSSKDEKPPPPPQPPPDAIPPLLDHDDVAVARI